ncbi:Ribonuclease P protein component [Helicobacter heilmannii]|uniref:ribonuclease P protein component n=1 Tax=Helicobacter heilmannii TaxID=35817 RepID=UPI0006A1EEBB|nr:ribonuclease P protein component [Helicobacter heilmannii]CRF49469.1 Ribonuclease P protein component [Helicobacter heilmannii]CRF50218.1 Ribonuclease P protein component [Helicobacter heilmannii]
MQSLKTTQQFSYTYKKGMRTHRAFFAIYSLPLEDLPPFFGNPKNLLLGLSVSKKVGKAVQRNLLKRRVRTILNHVHLENQVLVFVAKAGITSLSYLELKQQILACLKRKHPNKGVLRRV